MPRSASNMPLCRVSSAAITSTCANTSRARAVKSSRLPMGVATTYSVPAPADACVVMPISMCPSLYNDRHAAVETRDMQERLILRTWKAAVLATLSLLAAGCQTPQTATTGPSAERLMAQADRLSRDKQYAAAAQAYEELAAKQTGELRSRILLRAARDWLRVPEVTKAQALLPQIIDQSLPSPDRVLRQLVGARIALLQRQPERALAELDRIPAPYPRDQAAEILELRTLALFDYGRPVGAVMSAIDR